jgi:DNA-binding NtrC family response regulator
VVDDARSFREATVTLLERQGYVCEGAQGGAEASELLARAPYDLLITDLRMPGNESLELLHECARRYPAMPMLVVTGYPSFSSVLAALRLTVSDYLVKPFEFDELRAAIERALRKAGSAPPGGAVGMERRA